MARVVRIHENGGPEVLRFDDIEVAPPGPGEVTLQVKALGLNRAESMFRSGQYLEAPVFPARLGYEAAGVVSAIGPDVTGFAIGDAVSVVPPLSITRWGMYGEVATVPADVTVKHPASLGWTEAAAVWMQYVTVWGALIDLAKLQRGDAVVITAASSSVGLAAIQLARSVGATAIATTRTNDKAQALRTVGADHVIVTQDEDLVARVRNITGDAGARVAFDPIGGSQVLQLAEVLANDGVLIEYGALSPEPTPFPLFAALGKQLSVHGYTYQRVVRDPAKLAAAKQFILDGLASGALKPVIDRVFPLEQIVDAHRYLESNQQFGKIVVTV
ncbi:NADPH:quinone reductase [Ralstonia sp. A12]|uniref:zinc-dependent alcohol dehydrogenase family protein n=1 Tax=Ralstonia sp. A12 TaxID=1217052 RepID=UPI00057382C6|nr:zinc-dependent alcohol dehydrogenase family protein [Ralstonia sp. A12]KHK53591.1 NADPH:quinone reductase [Ralstonia sp. A12]